MSLIIHADDIRGRRELAVYELFLGHLSDLRPASKFWITLPQDVNRWWVESCEMQLVLEDGKWRIEGKGKQQARVACAALPGDDIHHFLDRSASSA